MPPKKTKEPTIVQPSSSPYSSPISSPSSDRDLASKIESLTSTIASFTSRFDRLEKILAETKAENSCLKESVRTRDSEIFGLRQKVNALEQYQRSWSVRILNVPIPKEDSQDNLKVMQHVFNLALLPILKGAVDRKLLITIPSVEMLLETAHILPSKEDKPSAVIARFYTRNLRSLIFQLKKDHAPRLPSTQQPTVAQPGAKPSMGKYAYPIYEDLTKINFNLMRELSSREEVFACWSVAGNLRYRLKNDTTVRKVKSVFSSVDSILANRK